MFNGATNIKESARKEKKVRSKIRKEVKTVYNRVSLTPERYY